MTIAKSINKTLDISVEDVRIDLTATIRSYDLTDTQFIFEIKSSNGMTVNLTGSTAMYIVEYVHNSQTYAIQGDVNIIGTDTLSFNLPEGLKGYSGTVLIGIYVKLTDGTKIDIKDIAVRIEPSIMDKDIDFSAKTYFKDFEKVKAEVILEGEKVKTTINAVVSDVNDYADTQKQAIDNIVSDVQSTGDTAKAEIKATLPTLQSQVSELKSDLVYQASDLDMIKNDVYSKKITSLPNAETNTSYEFIKGKKYKINIKSNNATTVQVGTLLQVGDASYIDKTPILSGSPIDYDFIFIASENAHVLYRYKLPSSATVDITVEEVGELALATKNELNDYANELKNNSVSIYDFNGTKDGVLECEAWEQGNGYITRTHSGDLFSDIVVAPKYVTAFDRVITYDFVPYDGTNICAFTKCSGYDYFWKQGYFVSVDFYSKTFAIFNKYGNDDTTPSINIPSVNKSVEFTENDYIGKKHRVLIERTKERGLKATLISLADYSVLATIESEFEALKVPSVGLGYDYPCFMIANNTRADLYYMGIKVKNATNCHLYIIGDSLTEGVAVQPSKAWAYMVAKSCPNTVVSGRGGATINSIIPRLESEAKILKPKYIMVMIGTNIGNTTEKLEAVINKIVELGSIPIINCIPRSTTSLDTTSINNQILELNTHHVRMDIATSINYDLNNEADTSLFLSDGVHLNEKGYERMYKQVLIDCPFLFN